MSGASSIGPGSGGPATELLFREDAYLSVCEAVVVDVAPEGGVLLDRTVFYPTGGGQPGDSGILEHVHGACRIATAVKGEGPAAVIHLPAEGETPPPIGARVTVRIDDGTRALHRRVHTALHLLSVVLPHPVTGGQIGAGKGRLDFDMTEPPGDKAEIEARLNVLIAGDHPVSAEWITEDELDARAELVKTMSVQPPRGGGRVRLVRIGAPEATVDLQPCGGTHVRRTGEIGRVEIAKIEKKGRQNRRVSIRLAD